MQAELRDLAQSLNRELVDLVNDNYHDFLSLGSTLAGGEEKLEEIRVGLLGFARDVKLLKHQVTQKAEQVAAVLNEKRALRKQMSTCYTLLETADRLHTLETWLGVPQPVQPPQEEGVVGPTHEAEDWVEEWQDTLIVDDEDGITESIGISTKLKRCVDQYLALRLLSSELSKHPLIVAQQGRVEKVHDILRRDLEDVARQQTELRLKQKIIQLRAQLDE